MFEEDQGNIKRDATGYLSRSGKSGFEQKNETHSENEIKSSIFDFDEEFQIFEEENREKKKPKKKKETKKEKWQRKRKEELKKQNKKRKRRKSKIITTVLWILIGIFK